MFTNVRMNTIPYHTMQPNPLPWPVGSAGCWRPLRVVQAAAAAAAGRAPLPRRLGVPTDWGGGAVLALPEERRGEGGWASTCRGLSAVVVSDWLIG